MYNNLKQQHKYLILKMNYSTIINYILLFINIVVIYKLYKIHKREKEEEEVNVEEEEVNVEEEEVNVEEEEVNVEEEEVNVEEEEVNVEEEEVNVEEEVVNVEEEVVNVETVAISNEVEKKDINTWYKFEDGKGRYKGEWKNGLPNGKGIKHTYKDDSYVYGNFVDGFAEGYGKQTFEQTWEKTQPYYEGEFNKNKYNGKGEYHYGDGHYYKGMWKDGKYYGQGAAYSKHLDKTWVGEYKNDEKVEGNWVKGEI
jgi:hypothetical protein